MKRALLALACLLVMLGAVAPRAQAHAHMGKPPFNVFVLADELELGYPPAAVPLSWDAMSWIGNDYDRLWITSEGDVALRDREAEGEVELFYGHLFAPFWELRIGVRGQLQAESGQRSTRGQFAFGLEGLAPYLFELEPTVFLSQRGELSARVHGSYSLRITQRLVLQPSAELNMSLQADPSFGVGKGFNDLQVGARLRYEIKREVAPYLGFEWTRSFGQTADLARAAGKDVAEVKAVLGARLWY